MLYNSTLVDARVNRFRAERVRAALYRAFQPLQVTAWEVPDEPVPFAEAVTKPFAPFAIGDRWGPPWGTVWFRARGHVPDGWRIQTGTSVELVVDLGFTAALPQGVLRVAARIAGSRSDENNRLTDGRIDLSRLVGSGPDAALRMAALRLLATTHCTIGESDCGGCPLAQWCQSAPSSPARS